MILAQTGRFLAVVLRANIRFMAVLYIVSPLLPCLSPQPTAYVESTQGTQWEPSGYVGRGQFGTLGRRQCRLSALGADATYVALQVVAAFATPSFVTPAVSTESHES